KAGVTFPAAPAKLRSSGEAKTVTAWPPLAFAVRMTADAVAGAPPESGITKELDATETVWTPSPGPPFPQATLTVSDPDPTLIAPACDASADFTGPAVGAANCGGGVSVPEGVGAAVGVVVVVGVGAAESPPELLPLPELDEPEEELVGNGS